MCYFSSHLEIHLIFIRLASFCNYYCREVRINTFATEIQRVCRGYLVRRFISSLKKRMNCSAKIIQSKARKWLNKRNMAAVMIQSRWKVRKAIQLKKVDSFNNKTTPEIDSPPKKLNGLIIEITATSWSLLSRWFNFCTSYRLSYLLFDFFFFPFGFAYQILDLLIFTILSH